MSANWIDAIKDFTDGVEQGVLTNDMSLVRKSLEDFLGVELVGMSIKEINDGTDTKEDLDEDLQQRLDLEDFKEETRKTPYSSPSDEDDFTMPASEKTDNSRQRLAKRKSIDLDNRENKFVDDGTIEVDEAGANLINDSVAKPVERSRRPSEGLMSIICHLCGKSEMIPPSLKREHYRCSACCKG
tara:strand:- start:9596 stop:10150 length:555 start_codon:yes stop_codon:yes gene_type:complete